MEPNSRQNLVVHHLVPHSNRHLANKHHLFPPTQQVFTLHSTGLVN